MQRSVRHQTIIRSVGDGQLSIDQLTQLTGASAVTIRRDLDALSAVGAIRRVRGGAASPVSRGTDYPFALRQEQNRGVKRRLAEAAAGYVHSGDSLVIDNGTTAHAVAVAIADRGVTALPLSLHAAAVLAAHPGNTVTVPGGPVNHSDLSFSSAQAVDAVRGMRFDTAVLGTCAADPATGLTVADPDDAYLKRALIAVSHRVMLVATSDKFARTATHHIGDHSDVDVIITDSDLSPVTAAELRDTGVELIIVPAEPE
ncbi:MAG: DeoR/GlpR family DNA-binding transcription regulator [Mycetocola sp.]